eukprot:9479286-Pyramimonas_sp.AAC.2
MTTLRRLHTHTSIRNNLRCYSAILWNPDIEVCLPNPSPVVPHRRQPTIPGAATYMYAVFCRTSLEEIGIKTAVPQRNHRSLNVALKTLSKRETQRENSKSKSKQIERSLASLQTRLPWSFQTDRTVTVTFVLSQKAPLGQVI